MPDSMQAALVKTAARKTAQSAIKKTVANPILAAFLLTAARLLIKKVVR